MFRLLEETDYEKGFPHILTHLTILGDYTKDKFLQYFSQQSPNKEIWVYESNGTILATASVLYEFKWSRGGSMVAHIEDVVVHPSLQGQGLGKKLMIFLIKQIEENKKVYKIILDCNDSNITFYEKCGFVKKENQMVIYF